MPTLANLPELVRSRFSTPQDALLSSVVSRAVDGPLVGAVVATALETGRDGLARLLRSIIRWRAGIRWYATVLLIALALPRAGITTYVAVVLGFRFAGPIHNLAEAANRIREGDLEARAEVLREDEIGLLAETFNEMADELEERVAELHEFKKFFEVSPEMLCIAGTDGYFKRANPAFSRVLGWGDEQLLGHPFYDLVHPDDLEATQQEIEKLSKGIPTISFVNRFRCEDGSYKCLRWNSYPDTETGLLYAIAREIEDPQAS